MMALCLFLPFIKRNVILSRELSIIMSLGPTDDDAADGLEKNIQYNVVSTYTIS